MVQIAPAAGLGLLVLFILGTYLAQVILKQVVENQDRDIERFPYRPPLRLGFLTEQRLETLSYILGGGGAIVLTVAILIWVPRVWAETIWRGLIGLGILFGIATFFLFGPSSRSAARVRRPTRTKPKPLSQSCRPRRPEHSAEETVAGPKEQVWVRARSADRVKILAMLRHTLDASLKPDVERPGTDRWGLGARRRRKATYVLADALNELFFMGQIPVKEPFGPALEADGVLSGWIEAVVEIDWVSCYVEVQAGGEALDVQQVSNQLVRAFGRGCSDAMLISTGGFTAPAVLVCKDALARKKVILCELAELARLLEQDGELKDFLLQKIAAAVVHEDPFYKPLA